MKTLVIVESPAKAKKIQGFLGSGYVVKASLGHVRDLPASRDEIPEKYRQQAWANLGVDPETFQPIYVVPAKKRHTVKDLKSAAQAADRVLFASDADREGEAIAWHLSRLLGVNTPERMTFTEITRAALTKAAANPRPLDLRLVAAQEARRVIDRLVGYTVSPLLWNTVGKGLSAGRVQSAALMLLSQRELARMRFIPASYWLIRADAQTKPPFVATVTNVRSREHPDGKPLVRAGDFTPDGKLKEGADVLQLTAEQAEALVKHIEGRAAAVTDVEQSEVRVRPAPPFTTSTLQQAAGRIGLGAKAAMDSAQRLYEGGYITYHRTDSPALSDEALEAARNEATRLFGPDAAPVKPRQYATRNANAQEAHEAIRPAGVSWRPPENTDLSGQDLALYTLVYQRTVASQMHDAVYEKTQVTLTCGAATLTATGRVLLQAGHTALLSQDKEDENDQRLPPLAPGQTFPLNARKPEEKRTNPPTRYTEATLVQAMEKAGIGRPSTYAQTLATLQNRAYAVLLGKHLAVTAVGLLVTAYLGRHVPDVLAREFTATMEAGLDEVAWGETTRVAYLTRFWKEGLAPSIQSAARQAPELPLPHLPDVTLHAGLQGPGLSIEGRRVTLPATAIPAEMGVDDLPALLRGTWVSTVSGKRERRGESNSTKPPRKRTARYAATPGQEDATPRKRRAQTGTGEGRARKSSSRKRRTE